MRWALFGLALLGMTLPVAALDKVTPEQIKATFAIGTAFTSTSPSGKVVSITLRPDGTGFLVAKGQTKPDTGKWRLTANGYCSIWGNATEHCYIMVKDGDIYTVMNNAGGVVARWRPPVATAPIKR